LYTYADESNPQPSALPWRREEFEKIISTFSLPRRLSQMISMQHAMFSAFKGSVPNRFSKSTYKWLLEQFD
jgi:hypothetical protein